MCCIQYFNALNLSATVKQIHCKRISLLATEFDMQSTLPITEFPRSLLPLEKRPIAEFPRRRA